MQSYCIAFSWGEQRQYQYAGSYAGEELIWVSPEDLDSLRRLGVPIKIYAQHASSIRVAVSANEFRWSMEKMARTYPGQFMDQVRINSVMYGYDTAMDGTKSTMAYTNTTLSSAPKFKSEKQIEKEKKDKKHADNIKKLLTHRKNNENRQTRKS